MFLTPLEAQSRGKTLEMITEKRMQNMVRLENKNIIFADKIHFEKSQTKGTNSKRRGCENNNSIFKDRLNRSGNMQNPQNAGRKKKYV